MTAPRNIEVAGWRQRPHRQVSELLSRAASGSRQTCLRVVDLAAPGLSAGRVPHRHRRLEEVIYVDQGEAEMWIDGETVRCSAGDAVAVPPGAWHYTRPLVEGVRLICFFPDPAPDEDYEEQRAADGASADA